MSKTSFCYGNDEDNGQTMFGNDNNEDNYDYPEY